MRMYILNPTFIKELAVFYQKSVPVPNIKCFRYCGFKKENLNYVTESDTN